MHSERRSLGRGHIDDMPSLGRRHKGDHWLVVACALLLAIGLIVIYAIGPALGSVNKVSPNFYTYRQLLAILISVVGFVITSSVPLKFWKKGYKLILITAFLATLLAIIASVNPLYPAHRWVRLGSLSFQSVELLKFAIIIWLASFLAMQVKNNALRDFKRSFLPVFGAISVIGIIVAAIQSDLGSTVVLVAIFGSMIFVAGISLKWMAYLLGIFLIGVILAITFFPYRVARLNTFLHPQANCQGSGYQACQALIAVGSGGSTGLGLGKSVQAYGYEPEASNDSIFAIYAETFGFVGSAVLLALYMFLFFKLKSIAERTEDNFSRYIIIGTIAWIGTQSIINIGAMIGLLPLKGITLPFISYGGTSVVFIACIMGVAFQISRYTSYQKISVGSDDRRDIGENSIDGRRLGRSHYTSSSSSLRD